MSSKARKKVLAGGGERDPGGAERDLLRFAEREHVRVARRQDPLLESGAHAGAPLRRRAG